jgi:hypothetical protein
MGYSNGSNTLRFAVMMKRVCMERIMGCRAMDEKRVIFLRIIDFFDDPNRAARTPARQMSSQGREICTCAKQMKSIEILLSINLLDIVFWLIHSDTLHISRLYCSPPIPPWPIPSLPIS